MVPSGTQLPSAASVRGLDANSPDVVLLGVVYRFDRVLGGQRMFVCEAPVSGVMVRRELPECDIELLDMPVDGWPELGNVAP